MKKVLVVFSCLFMVFCGYVLYGVLGEKSTYSNDVEEKIPILNIEEERVDIDEIYIYGTHLNLHGKKIIDENINLVLYNGEENVVSLNKLNDGFNLSSNVNDGLYLEDIPRGNYFVFLREEETNEEGIKTYKYYALTNISNYKETVYYTFSDTNNKIVINSEESYPTMMINVLENTDEDIYDIVIDPGHGGMDGGASRYGYKESDFTLDLAVKIKDDLEKKGFKVKLTHEVGQLTDNEKLNEYGVHGRAVIPYEVHAKYLFSLHMNSSEASSMNGLEIYTASDINFDFAKKLAESITSNTGLRYSSSGTNRVSQGIYTRKFTQWDVYNSKREYEMQNLKPYDITTNSIYYYIIRETGGIITGAYVDDRNDKIVGNPYCYSNIGIETYLLELGYISNRNDLDNMKNKIDNYVKGITDVIGML